MEGLEVRGHWLLAGNRRDLLLATLTNKAAPGERICNRARIGAPVVTTGREARDYQTYLAFGSYRIMMRPSASAR